jgi:hypothetical protein
LQDNRNAVKGLKLAAGILGGVATIATGGTLTLGVGIVAAATAAVAAATGVAAGATGISAYALDDGVDKNKNHGSKPKVDD